MRPPFTLTPGILNTVAEISLLLGRYEGLNAPKPQPQLRRQNTIKTIQGSLAIEGNTLSLEQMTAVFDKKRVIGPSKEILEVQNAVWLYERLGEFRPANERDFLKAHAILMKGLTLESGRYRSRAVGILKGSQVSHLAPPAKRVPELMAGLFSFLKKDKDLPELIRACVFHYELEFIHPFLDGNGRMGRFWQSVILVHHHPAFEFVPVESVIKARQAAYYRVLGQSDRKGESTSFIEFTLLAIRDALRDFLEELRPEAETPESRLAIARTAFKDREFTRKEYLQLLKRVSTATASRDLALGVERGLLRRVGHQALTRYHFVRDRTRGKETA
ncbi:MAG: Fic family protein [Oligoflexia bacterium]|nr:Fic family protein [Oligoflexia bacterium]